MDFFIESQVKTFATFGDFPATGQVKTIYIDEATSNQYYWNGLSYVGLSDSNKVPYTGATGNVDLGENELKAGQITLDTSPTGTAAVGTTRWNNATGTSETTLKGGSVILKNGVDLVARVVNKVTPNTTLTKANYTAVRVSGAQGQRLAVAYAQANNDNNSADTIGLVIETIATNQEGFIMTVGQLDGINTTGSLQGETWVDGDVLYLSPTTPGALTNIKPTGLTGHIVVMGYVEYAHAVNGKIYVKIMNGWELDELHNVYIDSATLANNNILQYDSADQLWKNKVLSTGLTVGTTPISSGTIGRVLFQGTGNVLQQSSSLFWDSTNNRLGIGTNTPVSILNLNSNNNPRLTLSEVGRTETSSLQMIQGSVQFNANAYFDGTNWQRDTTALPSWNLNMTPDGNDRFAIRRSPLGSGAITWTEFLSVRNTGNVLINTTTDAGFRLDVNGTARTGFLAVYNGFNLYTGGVSPNSHYFEATSASATDATFNFRRNGNANGIMRLNLYGLQLNSNNSTGECQMLVGSGGFFPTFYSNGSERMRIDTSGNVGIGTSSPSTKLHVSGSIPVVSNLAQGVLFNNTITATSASDILVGLDINPTFGGNNSSNWHTLRLWQPLDQYGDNRPYLSWRYGNSGGDQYDVFRMFMDAGWKVNFKSTGAQPGFIFTGGNLMINTTTDSGFRLDVNGTARVVDNFSLGSGTGAFDIDLNKSKGGGVWSSVRNTLASSYSAINLGTNNTTSKLTIYSFGSSYGSSGQYQANKSLLEVIGDLFLTASNFIFYSGSVGVGTTTPNASALMDIASTTKGFLPPRMTTTQKNAIASPATGLQVYDTTLNQMSYYNGTTWTNI